MSISALLAEQVAGLWQPSPEQLRRIDAHWDLLVRWNKKINLTRILDPAEAALRHYGESIFLGLHLTPGRVADVGSGAGFPGIPVAIMRPDCQVDLIESTLKKAVFLEEASRDISNVRVISKRAEDLGACGQYEWVISRAVNPKEVLGLELKAKVALLLSRADGERLAGAGKICPLPWNNNRVLLIRST